MEITVNINVFSPFARNRRKKRKISNKIIIIPKGSISLNKVFFFLRLRVEKFALKEKIINFASFA